MKNGYDGEFYTVVFTEKTNKQTPSAMRGEGVSSWNYPQACKRVFSPPPFPVGKRKRQEKNTLVQGHVAPGGYSGCFRERSVWFTPVGATSLAFS